MNKDIFQIKIGNGLKKAIWDSTRINCGLCGKMVGLAFELETKIAILFELESPTFERHICEDKKEMRLG